MPTFTLLTLNCFGVPIPATGRRLRALAHTLETLDADVVCLQEVQANVWRRLLIHFCKSYPYHAWQPFIHAPKGGLLTLSRRPIHDWRFVLYDERGLWYTPALADWILHKGVLITNIAHDGLPHPIAVMNTHLTANYTGDWSPVSRFARHEWEQLQQLAALVRAQPADSLVVVAGDFNIPRGSWLSEQFLAQSGLIDPLANDLRPTYRPLSGLPARFAVAIDFNLYRAPAAMQETLSSESAFRFTEKQPMINGELRYLSDHMGVELRLTW
jgi:endonuclease/exonuclease/phosphatase family metal-dependent hydrolase